MYILGFNAGHDGTAALICDGQINRICATPAKYSSGVFYSAVTKYLGFRHYYHEGKTTGLAAYGCPDLYYDVMKPCPDLYNDRRSFRSNFADRPIKFKVPRLALRLINGSFFRNVVTNFLLDYFQQELAKASKGQLHCRAAKTGIYWETFIRVMTETRDS